MSFFVIAGETSGDLYGGELIKAMKKINPDLNFKGVGGASMLSAGFNSSFPISDFNVMGFSDVIKAFPRLKNRFELLVEQILKEKPEGVIFIDYPGFNLRLSERLRKRGYKGKLIHYIAPTVWAWGKGRIGKMSKHLDLLITIYPFEASYFTQTPLDVKFVGHPLKNHMDKNPYLANWKDEFNIPKEKPLIALFPGSRPAEIRRNLPLILKTATHFLEKNPEYGFAISVSDAKDEPLIRDLLKKSSISIGVNSWLVPSKHRYHTMKDAKASIAKSGTVTLELALSGCPTVVVYQLSSLNYFLARYLFKIRLPYFSLPNILLSKMVFPEWIGLNFDPKEIARSLEQQLLPERKTLMNGHKEKLEELLTQENASERAAHEILQLCTIKKLLVS